MFLFCVRNIQHAVLQATDRKISESFVLKQVFDPEVHTHCDTLSPSEADFSNMDHAASSCIVQTAD